MISRKKLIFAIILLLVISIIKIEAVDIELSSSITDIEESTYIIKSKVISLNTSSDYTLTGECTDCQISVEKGLSPKITLNSLKLDNTEVGPFVIKKSSSVNLILSGESTITDNEEDESAAIKIKSSSSLIISGTGKLNIIGTKKNGIKGASGSNLTINEGTYNISATNNAIAADGSVIINGGTFIIKSTEGDGIKSDPDYGDNESEGTITINGGTFNISAYNDGIQAKSKITINDGTFYIKTYDNGASSTNFDKDEESAKGIKCSWNETNITIMLTINGGTFYLDTADDSLHSDGNITIIGGIFSINSGDDGVHADQNLILGKSNADNSLIKMNISKSYEGLEGAKVSIYSGIYNIIASDDGINSAGDTDENCEMNNRPGNGNRPGNFWKNNKNYRRNLRKRKLAECNSFHMYIYGGEIYVNAGADGLDANGNIEISGGNITVWGAPSGVDGDPIDLDGSLTISGGTLLAGGNQGMTRIDSVAKNSQKYISSSTSYNANQNIYVVSGDNTIREALIPKKIQYLYYTSPSVDSSYKFSTTAGKYSSTQSTTSSSIESNESDENFSRFTNLYLNLKINIFTLFIFIFIF